MPIKNLTVLLGRNPHDSEKLTILFSYDSKTYSLNIPVSDNENSISRLIPAEKKSHCRIEFDADGNMRIVNANVHNYTYVDGIQILDKSITVDSRLQLGAKKIDVSVKAIIDAINNAIQEPMEESFDIAPLHEVYNHYRKKLRAIKRRMNIIRTCLGLPTVALLILRFLIDPKNETMTIVLYAIAGLCALAFVITYFVNNSESKERMEEELEDYLVKNYTCPKCNKYLGNKRLEFIKVYYQNKCPHCHVKFYDSTEQK